MTHIAITGELKDTNGRVVLRPTLHHTSNYTTRVDEMIEWYRNVVGMEITSSPQALPGHFVSNDGAHHRMSFFQLQGMSADVVRDAAGVNHIAFEYPTVDELLESWERLRDLGIVPHTTVDHGPSFSFYYWDPDGNNVELFTDAFGDWDRSMTFFREDPEFQRNPMGKQVDPARLLEARRSGISQDELHDRARRGEYGVEEGDAKPHYDGWDGDD
jgi:catechol 2,3-dioxygenase